MSTARLQPKSRPATRSASITIASSETKTSGQPRERRSIRPIKKSDYSQSFYPLAMAKLTSTFSNRVLFEAGYSEACICYLAKPQPGDRQGSRNARMARQRAPF